MVDIGYLSSIERMKVSIRRSRDEYWWKVNSMDPNYLLRHIYLSIIITFAPLKVMGFIAIDVVDDPTNCGQRYAGKKFYMRHAYEF